MAGVARREIAVHVGAEPEERDVAEVEQTGEAHDHVEAEREKRVDQRDQPVTKTVALGRHERKDRGGECEHEQPPPTGSASIGGGGDR